MTALSSYRVGEGFSTVKQLISGKNIAAASDINRELILRFQPRSKTDIEVMVGKTNTKAKYSTCVVKYST